MEKKIKWLREGKQLRATVPVAPRGFESYLREEDMDPIQAWCEQVGYGRRMSFDTFKFKTRAEITAFLLKWS